MNPKFLFILECLGRYFSQSDNPVEIQNTFMDYMKDREKFGPQFGFFHKMEKFLVGGEEDSNYYLFLNSGEVWLLQQKDNGEESFFKVDVDNPPYMGSIYY